MERAKITKKKEFEEANERTIVIGLITSTAYIEKLRPIWNIRLIESNSAKRLASWVMDYYDQYNEAPGRTIENIFFQKAKNLPKDIAEEIENDILPALSKEYEQEEPINVQYLLDGTITYFKRRHWELHRDQVNTLIREGNLSEAEKLIKAFKPYEGVTTNKLDGYIWSLEEMLEINIEKPLLLMRPWLRAGQTTFIYGDCGTGKSLLAIHIASLLALRKEDAENCNIGEWQVYKPTGCLYVDGEMGVVDLCDRLSQFEYLGEQQFPTKVFPLPEYQLATEDDFILSERENQLQIIRWLQNHPDYRLLILDSVTTLFGLTDENSNAEWNNKINPFLRDLRALGVAVILLHHSGKDSSRGLRGASAMGAMAHNIFCLKNHNSKDIDEGEAWFVLSKKKQRAGGFQFKSFALHYTQNSALTETEWEVCEPEETKDEGLNTKQVRIIKYVLSGKYTQTEIAERVGCKPPYVTQVKKKARELGYLQEDDKPTQLWEELIQKFENKGDEEE